MSEPISKADERLVSMVAEGAVRRGKRAIDLLRRQLADAERELTAGRAPDARNMGQHVADLAEAAGVISALRDLGAVTP